jgi:hypothetical protein
LLPSYSWYKNKVNVEKILWIQGERGPRSGPSTDQQEKKKNMATNVGLSKAVYKLFHLSEEK